MRRLLGILFVLVLVAAACGDDGGESTDEPDAESTDATEDADVESSDDDEEESDEPDGDEDTDPDGDDTETGDRADGSDEAAADLPTGGEDTDFCQAIDELDDEEFDPFGDPESVETYYREVLSRANEIRGSAPDEIADDVDVLLESTEDLVGELEAVDWDFFALDPDVAGLIDPEVQAATDRVDSFCGIDEPSFDDIDPSDGTDVPFDAEDLPVDPEDLGLDPGDFDLSDSGDFAVDLWKTFGHDDETAQCLADAVGEDTNAFAEDLTTQICGLSVFEIFSPPAG